MNNAITFTTVKIYDGYSIVCCEQTKVMYILKNDTFTLLVNADGTPMLWEE